MKREYFWLIFAGCFASFGCDDANQVSFPLVPQEESSEEPVILADAAAVYGFADSCVVVGRGEGESRAWLKANDLATAFEFSASAPDDAARFFMKASDLGTYLFYDEAGGYLVAEDGPLERKTSLDSDVYQLSDAFVSEAEWMLEPSPRASMRFQLRHRRTGSYLSAGGLEDARFAGALTLEPAEGCKDHPEMSLDASGTVGRTTYEDGTLYGFVDTHSHILSNFGFGGGGIFHGAPFHRLGVEHALGDCELFHGPEGRADLLGVGFGGGVAGLDPTSFLTILSTGRWPEPLHATDGWPTFSDWPSQTSATHNTQYYKWLERAWMGGMRLMVQHAVSNDAFCQVMGDTGFQPLRWSCNDMVNIDRQLLEIRRMEQYIDAQWGGPGKGWFRVVESPAEARKVIEAGKLAIILGIEVPNLFDCFLTPRDGSPECTDEYIESQLDLYQELGIRVLFPNHKYDNAFTPGDGQRGMVELGNFLTTAHWANFVQECPEVADPLFDRGPVQFGGFNQPREVYLSEAPNELLELSGSPIRALAPYLDELNQPALDGEWCQKAGLTLAGRTLMRGIMKRGMIPEIDHLPRRSYADAFAMLQEANYPAAGTHGSINGGQLYELGGVSKSGFTTCADPAEPGSKMRRFRERRALIEEAGLLPAEGFGFDLNGLAGVPDPRFGDDSRCVDQENPVDYPFTSFAGDVTFTQPFIGEREIDFNTEGMIHIGLVPELIEDALRTGASDDDMDIIFKSAEAYIQMWERAEARSAALDGE